MQAGLANLGIDNMGSQVFCSLVLDLTRIGEQNVLMLFN
jgi:hypothetical protein